VKPDSRFQDGLRIYDRIPLIDRILEGRSESLKEDFVAYGNHCHRVANFCLALSGENDADPDKVFIAAAFHDLGIWTHRTFDYLEPSVELLSEQLKREGKLEWLEEIRPMVLYHHKITPYRGAGETLVEAFRKADWIDVTWGIVRAGVPGNYIRKLQHAFPNAGFHKRLSALAGRRFLSHPWSPLPMVKW
jgi:hypothetical protein